MATSSNKNTDYQTVKRKEIYKYEAPWTLYAMNWSVRRDKKFRLAVGSFIEEYANKVRVITLNENAGQFQTTGQFDHPYPTNKIMWIPDSDGKLPDLLTTSGDYLRIWKINSNHDVTMECLLNNNRNTDFCAPLTSFDWNQNDPNLIGTSSIDTTCTIWNLETKQVIGRATSDVTGHVKTQLIAHDKEVYDIAFSDIGGGRDIFASVGGDGSLRMFDLRNLQHSTIIYESQNSVPLLRLAWSKQNSSYLATIAKDSRDVTILDIRVPNTPIAMLKNHQAVVNGFSWAPHCGTYICTAADDKQALIWNLDRHPREIKDPILAYKAGAEINQIHWSSANNDWIAICFDNCLEILRV